MSWRDDTPFRFFLAERVRKEGQLEMSNADIPPVPGTSALAFYLGAHQPHWLWRAGFPLLSATGSWPGGGTCGPRRSAGR